MIKEAIGMGETVVKAQQMACEILGVPAHEVQVEILQLPMKKTLGLFGGKEAKVRVFYKISKAKKAQNYLQEILEKIGIKGFTIQSKEEKDGVEFSVLGERVNAAIGRRGETLAALQYLCGLVANEEKDGYYRVVINVSDYRERREQTLLALGKKLSFKAINSCRPVELEPMSPYERRIIHLAVKQMRGVTSHSEGEDTKRHVVITSNGEVPPRKFPPRPNTAFRPNNRFVSNERPNYYSKDRNAPVYSKVDLKG